MDINLKITLPSQTELDDFCESMGWDRSMGTKKDFLRNKLNEYIRNMIKSKRVRDIEVAKRLEVKTATDSIDTELSGIVAI